MEVIVLTNSGILIQDLEKDKVRNCNEADLKNIRECINVTVDKIRQQKKMAKETKSLQKMMFEKNIIIYGKENVRMDEKGEITVTVKDKEHRIWVEST